MTTYVQLTSGLHLASNYTQFYELALGQTTRVLLQVWNDSTSAIYDSSLQYLARAGTVTLDPGTYIVKASYGTTTNAVMAVYIPSQAVFNSLPALSSGSYKAVTYSHFYALNIKEAGNLFITPGGDSARTVIYDTNLNFVAFGGADPIHLDQGNYIVNATFSGFRNGALSVSIPDAIRGTDGAMYPSPLLKSNVFQGMMTPDVIDGLDGNDRFTGYFDYWMPDSFFGGAGTDTAVYRGAAHEYSIQAKVFQDARKLDGILVSGLTVSDRVPSRDGTDNLNEVERLQFSDRCLAFDLGPLEAAGQVARILGAVFGKEAVANREYVGFGLKLMDAGLPYEETIAFALNTRLGDGTSHESVVDLLYSNLFGILPSDSERDYYVSLLNGGIFNQATLGALAADANVNAVNIDLIGLSARGLAFLPAA